VVVVVQAGEAATGRIVMMRLPDGIIGDALFLGDNREHRLWLERRLESVPRDAPYGLWIGMNPSVAGANEDDMTVRKEWTFTRLSLNLSRYVKMNVGTYICTDPSRLPLGLLTHPANDGALRSALPNAAAIVMATGVVPYALEPALLRVLAILRNSGRPLLCLGRTADGSPRHSSRRGYNTPLVEFKP
jgi:hypothetical protein